MFRSRRNAGAGAGRLQFAALAVLACPLLDCEAARADLVPCTIYFCSIQNPLAVTSGNVEAWTTDGEAVVQNSDSVTWSLTYNHTNLAPLVPLSASSSFSLPDVETYETATASASLNVTQGLGYVLLNVSASNDNPYGLDLGGASAEGALDYQVTVLGKPGASTAPPDGTPVTLDIAGLLRGVALTGSTSRGSLSTGSATVTIADGAGNLIFATQAQNTFGDEPFNTTITIDVGSVYNVEIDASIFAQGNSGGSVFADPDLTIDPSTADANDLFILYSNGIGQDFGLSGAPVPDPSTLAYDAAGLRGPRLGRISADPHSRLDRLTALRGPGESYSDVILCRAKS